MTDPFLANIALFVLATFLGVDLVGRVPPTLHTPLMSAANAVSGISICGAIAIAGSGHGPLSQWLGFFATVFAMINAVRVYKVTGRMLAAVRKDQKESQRAHA